MDEKHLALLVEDDSNWVRYFKETVEVDPRNCFEFRYANSLAAALQELEKTSFSVVFLDLILPDSQGQDTVSAILKQVKYSPIVILTTLADKKMQDFAFCQGVEDYLVKDEYDEKVFFHVASSAVNRCISKIQKEFYDDLAALLEKLKSVAVTLDEVTK